MPSPLIPRPDVDEESASSSQDDESMSVSPTDGFVVAAGPGPSGDTRSKSLATRIKALSVAKPPAKHPMSFLLGMFAIFCVCIPATICFIFLILLALALIGIPIAEVVIGSLYLDAKFCSEHSIPILLIVGGCVALAGILVDVGCRCKFEDEGQYPDGERWRKEFDACVLFRLIMKFALLTWLIWSAVVVFQYYDKVSYEEGDRNYCRPILYRFLFWKVAISLGILACGLVLLCCATCCICWILTSGAEQ